eukprot:486874-Pleurochrysis_carterae.AAC.1
MMLALSHVLFMFAVMVDPGDLLSRTVVSRMKLTELHLLQGESIKHLSARSEEKRTSAGRAA